MKPSPSPLNCLSYFVTELSVKANNGFDPEKPFHLSYDKINIDASKIETGRDDYPWQLTVTVSYKEDGKSNIPYEFSVTMSGWFSVSDGFPEDKKDLWYHLLERN